MMPMLWSEESGQLDTMEWGERRPSAMADDLLRQGLWGLAQVSTPDLVYEPPSMSETTHSLASMLVKFTRLLNRKTLECSLQVPLLVTKICRLLRLDGEETS